MKVCEVAENRLQGPTKEQRNEHAFFKKKDFATKHLTGSINQMNTFEKQL